MRSGGSECRGRTMIAQRQDSLDRTEIHDVLSNNRRCLVLENLSRNGPTTLRSLANDIAAVETNEDPAPRPARQSVYVTLHQSHLPKLDRLDIVDYDANSKDVQLGRRAEDLKVYLEVVESGEITTTEYQLGLAGVGLSATLASHVGVPALATISPLEYATGTIVVLVLALCYQLRQQGSPIVDWLRGRRQQN